MLQALHAHLQPPITRDFANQLKQVIKSARSNLSNPGVTIELPRIAFNVEEILRDGDIDHIVDEHLAQHHASNKLTVTEKYGSDFSTTAKDVCALAKDLNIPAVRINFRTVSVEGLSDDIVGLETDFLKQVGISRDITATQTLLQNDSDNCFTLALSAARIMKQPVLINCNSRTIPITSNDSIRSIMDRFWATTPTTKL